MVFLSSRILITVIILMTNNHVGSQDCERLPSNNKVLSCTGLKIKSIPISPYENPPTEFECFDCTELQLKAEAFNGYDELISIEIHNIKMKKQEHEIPLNLFSNLNKLKILKLKGSQLTDKWMWILPTHLTHYDVTTNEYTNLDISFCPNIYSLEFGDNALKNVPKFYGSAIPLTSLSVVNNPLDDFTVEQIAPYCYLHNFAVKLPTGAFLETNNGACECNRLKKWTKLFNISNTNLNCVELPNNTDCDINFLHIKDLRRHCSDADLLPEPPTEWWIICLIILAFVLLSVIVLRALYRRFLKKRKKAKVSQSSQMEQSEEVEEEE